jgi:Ser/Thr protein kinase RdoA (MazF antagonist)
VARTASRRLILLHRCFVLPWSAVTARLDTLSRGWPRARPIPNPNQPELPLAKPNYRHQKKQREQARKLRQEAKQNRRLAARVQAAVPAPSAEEGAPVQEKS